MLIQSVPPFYTSLLFEDKDNWQQFEGVVSCPFWDTDEKRYVQPEFLSLARPMTNAEIAENQGYEDAYVLGQFPVMVFVGESEAAYRRGWNEGDRNAELSAIDYANEQSWLAARMTEI